MEAFLLKHEVTDSKRNANAITVLSVLVVVGIIAVAVVPAQPNAKVMLAQKNILIQKGDLRALYAQWKVEYNPLISSDEDDYRFKIFTQNYKWIQNHNLLKNPSYTVALNQFAAFTSLEYKTLYSQTTLKISSLEAPKTLPINDLPNSIDWRENGAVTDVKSQGSCGADWAFAATGALEGLNFIQHNQLVSLSEQQLVDCSEEFGTQACNGGSVDQAFMYVRQNGIENNTIYPYAEQEGQCNFNSSDVAFKISGFTDVPQNNNDQLKAAVAQQPVSVMVDAGQSGFQFYANGIFHDSGCGTQLDHGMLIVGYGSQNTSEYWIVKNSWSPSWGLDGYILIARADGVSPGECGIAMAASYPSA